MAFVCSQLTKYSEGLYGYIIPRWFSGVNTKQQIESTIMPTGTIKWFDPEKGYGFITPDEGDKDLFVHHSETDGYALNEGDKVEFEVGQGQKGPCATGVKNLRGQ